MKVKELRKIKKYGGWIRTSFDKETLWYSEKLKKWGECIPTDCSNSVPCRTLRAFRRHLKKHTELQNVEMMLVSKYDGHNISMKRINGK